MTGKRIACICAAISGAFGIKVSPSPGGQTLQLDGVARLLGAATP